MDIYDGQAHEFLSNPSHVSLQLNTAYSGPQSTAFGLVRLSSMNCLRTLTLYNIGFYQICTQLCRFRCKYMLLAGVWYSKEKPTMWTFLRPLLDEIQHQGIHMYINAIHYFASSRNYSYYSRWVVQNCILLLSTVGLPARALVLHMKQYNGKHGCCCCNVYIIGGQSGVIVVSHFSRELRT